MLSTLRNYPIWLNLLGYQLLWFLAIFTGNHSLIVLAVCLTAHFWLRSEWKNDAMLMLICTTVGISIDSALALSGVYLFDPVPSQLPIPFWLLGIWLAFSATLRHGLRFFIARPPLALACAVVGAPIAYLSAGRLGAVEFPLGYLNTAMIIAAVWLPMMMLIIVSSRWIDSRQVI